MFGSGCVHLVAYKITARPVCWCRRTSSFLSDLVKLGFTAAPLRSC